MSKIDDAVTRLQGIAVQVTGVKFAPTYPTADATVFPLAIAHVIGAEGGAQDATWDLNFYNIAVDFHVNPTDLRYAYQTIDGIIPNYLNRLGGDPKLSGAVDTIVFPVTVEVTPAEYNTLPTIMARFNVRVKAIETHIAST